MRLINNPVLCNYYLTYRCNAACSFCDIWEKPSSYIRLEDLRDNLRDLKKLGVKVIDFTGGEPLLHRQLPLFLEESKKMGFITTVTTNCLLYPKVAPSLKGLIDMLHFSLDSPDEQEHNESRKVKCFDKVMESIEIAKRLGEKPDILFTVFENNVDKIEEVWKNITKPNNLVLILNPVFEYNNLVTADNFTEKSYQKLLWWGKQQYVYLNEAFIALRKDGGNNVDKPVCKAASSTIVISPENELILPCYHLGIEKFKISGNLYELYKSKNIQTIIKQEGKYEACEGCVINCYMQPSFAVELNKYFWKALPSTMKYNFIKGTWKHLF